MVHVSVLSEHDECEQERRHLRKCKRQVYACHAEQIAEELHAYDSHYQGSRH